MISARRAAGIPRPAVTVTDEWSGGADALRGTWPGEKFTGNDHEHVYHDGGYYAHRHARGALPHVHRYNCPCEGRGQYYQGEHENRVWKPKQAEQTALWNEDTR